MVPEKIRNVALVGHGGSGKTSLAEALLYVAGVTTRQGSVDAGTTLLDYEPEEQERKISLGLAVASLEWKGHRVNLIDTPGYADFSGDARTALRAADLALFVVSGVDGVEVQTEMLWKAAADEGIPRAIFITKLDRERASFARTLAQLREVFGKRVAPVQVPVGEEASLAGVVRVVSGKTFLYGPDDRTGTISDNPPDAVAALVEETHTALVESVVETDDDLMERYFEGEEPSPEVIVATVHKGMLAGEIFPVLVGSAPRRIGVDTLFEFLIDFAPNPLERNLPPLAAGNPPPVSAEGPALAYVFKTISDPFVGRISMFRVYSGTIAPDADLEIAGGGHARMHNLFYLMGKEHIDARSLGCGDIAAVAKAENVHAGATLRSAGVGITLAPVNFPRPVTQLAIFPKSQHDEEKLSTALQRMLEEDPTLGVERNAETGETVLSGLGDTHLDVTIARIHRKFGVEVETSLPKIPYRETITTSGEAEGKHKKQSGGRGQFGVANVKFSPRPRGSGYEYVDAVKGGAIPRQFIPAVDKGIQEALSRGVLAGYPVIDITAEVYDGKYHAVDSDELSFRMAGIQAVKAAATSLRPVLLEPIMRVTIRVPEEHTGDVMGDINAKRGRVLGIDSDGTARVIQAEIPMAEVQRYAADLRSMTSGRGTFELEFDHYAEMPHQEASKVIAAAAAERQGE
ncbi:MAG TPA: elongation factor G [Acidimicrobiia bacterium]|nr:elongation factor G [Acidimicrobiia bacterium]